jgi:hypothetical protein
MRRAEMPNLQKRSTKLNSIHRVAERFAFATLIASGSRSAYRRGVLKDEHRIVTSDGEQRVISGAVIDRFASDLQGELLFPEDERYDAVLKV